MKIGEQRSAALRNGLAALCLGALVLSGCGGLGVGKDRSAEAELAKLRERNLELRREAAMRDVEAERLRQRVASLEQQLGSGRGTAPPPPRRAQGAPPRPTSVASVGEPDTAPIAEPAATGIDLLGEIEETDLEDPEPPMVVATAPPPAEAPAPPRPTVEQPPTPPPVEAPPVEAPQLEAPPGPGSADAQSLYDRGYTFFHQKRYAEAESSFRQYLQRFPGTALADNAQFWIGESRYARGDFASALTAFSETVERYPDGNKVPDALVKAGKCLEALGQGERAKDTYREVMKRFPDSVAALTAEEQLQALGR